MIVSCKVNFGNCRRDVGFKPTVIKLSRLKKGDNCLARIGFAAFGEGVQILISEAGIFIREHAAFCYEMAFVFRRATWLCE